VPLTEPALQLLAEMKASARTEYLFPGRDGTGYLNIRTSWERVRKAAGLEDVRLHDLRHSFASILVSGGASLPLIGALLGHSNVATTNRYSHLYVDVMRAATERVGAIVTGGNTGQIITMRKGS
jgi:integrase